MQALQLRAHMVVPGLAVLLLLGAWCRALGWVQLSPWLLLSCGVGGVLLAVAARRGIVVVMMLGLATGAWAALMASTLEAPAARLPRGGLARLTIEPLRTGCGADNGCWSESRVLRCSALDADACPPVGALIALSTPSELPVGGRVTMLATVTPRPDFRNVAVTSRWPDLRPRLRARAEAAADVRMDETGWLSHLLLKARRTIRASFDATLAAPHAGIARALLLGEASAVAGELNDAIRNAGVSHVLAVSGMHVTVLVGGLAALVRALWSRLPWAVLWEARRVAALVGALLAPLVASLCGGSPSAVRAALTSTVMFGLSALGRRPSALAVSAFAVGVHIAIEPRDMVHPGFVLSVVATAALLTASQGPSSALLASLRESLRAWLSTAPFLLLCFGTNSVVAIFANVVLLPLGGLLIPAAVAQLFAALLGVDAQLGTRGLFELMSGAFVGAARLCSSLDPGLQVPALHALQVVLLSVVAGLWLLPCALRTRVVGSAVGLLSALVVELFPSSALRPSELQVLFLDVGQGDGALVQTGDGKTMLIDAGGSVNGGPDPGRASVLPMLSALRIRTLDVVVISHPHPDHYGGLRAVLENVAVRELWDTGQAEAEDIRDAQAIVALAKTRGARIVRPDELCRRARQLGGAHVKVLAPCPGFDEGYGPNDNSFVIKLEHGVRSVLFTGDVEREGETKLVARYGQQLASDVLKVAHHGSRTSSTGPLLSAVSPWLAVISAGQANRFGHPHQEVIERLTTAARHSMRLDEVGGVRMVSDGRTLRVSAWRPDVALQLSAR